ncbi:NAD-binding-2 domain-containing protein [Fusarium keratoplasticum]|uniref:NAD-binding-2 domain-containing protein n=1 Tax=Fusarium keratoplasticum TaxID=1328300 RepID=A0ACC0QE73_9HYPO|nr:NAD-binding-2 domain-containing protein [Fusarium keratoplasticum]KAI8648621.1 NAD-binding-2 domain-containing protein [Fusarium keratoplasticum]
MTFSTDRSNTIGFIGLGAMGNHMLNNLISSCSSPYDVAQKASTIISMVPTGKHVQEVYVGEGNSVLSALKSMSQDQRAKTL